MNAVLVFWQKSKWRRRKRVLILSACILLASICSSTGQEISNFNEHPDDTYWDTQFMPPRMFDETWVFSLGRYDNKFVIGGEFVVAGTEIANRIVGRSGDQWHKFGDGLDLLPFATTQYQGNLFACGDGPVGGTKQVHRIEQWDGSHWENISPGLNGTPQCLTVWHGKLVVGGSFDSIAGIASANVALWDGSTWSSPGGGTIQNSSAVSALATYQEKLIVSGVFDSAGGVECNNVAAWDGSVWTSFGSGANGWVSALLVTGDTLIVGGSFDSAGGVACRDIAKWDGTEWHGMGSGSNGNVSKLASLGNSIIASGQFDSIGGVPARKIAQYAQGNWSAMDTGLSQVPTSILVDGDSLIVGGAFSGPPPLYQCNLAVWRNGKWAIERGNGAAGVVHSMATYRGNLVVGGAMSAIGGKPAGKIAQWDGTTWSQLGEGVDVPEGMSTVTDIEIWNDLLIACGYFHTGNGSAKAVRAWDGTSWKALGDNPKLSSISRMTVFNGKLIACGVLGIVSGTDTILHVASWDGSEWSSLDFRPTVINPQTFTPARAVCSYNGELIVAGEFDSVSGVAARNIAAWDGNAWHSLGEPESYRGPFSVIAMSSFDGALTIGGYFWGNRVPGQPYDAVSRWDGSSWSTFGQGLDIDITKNGTGKVTDLCYVDGNLFVTGLFDTAGSVGVNSVAVWDGMDWSPLGSGLGKPTLDGYFNIFVPATGYVMHHYGDKLYIGGDFSQAGSHVSYGLASWSKGITVDVPETPPSKVIPESFLLQQNYPNPFNLSTTIRFSLPRKSEVTCVIHNLLGQRVRSLLSAVLPAGSHEVTWDGMNDGGDEVASGIYFYEFTVGEAKQSRKMVLLK